VKKTTNNDELVFIPYGGVGSVTGANFMLTSSVTKLLVDCGLNQGSHEADDKNALPFTYDASAIDILFITHSHIDHIGRVPKLVREGFRGVIYSTPATKEIAQVMFEDALKIMGFKERFDKKKPLYDSGDVSKAISLWKTVEYHESTEVAPDFTTYFKDAGHILGSAMIELTHSSGKKIVFTGDLGNSPTPLLKDTEAIRDVDYIVMESVYGDRNHESKEGRRVKLRDLLRRVIERKGTAVIPAFSLERTQVLLYEINNMVEEGEIPSVPVFLDSPLAIKLTEIYKNYSKHYNSGVQDEISGGDDIFSFPKLKFTDSSRDSQAIEKVSGPKIVIAGSGMSMGGRVMEHEKDYLPDPKNMVLLVGYQGLGTLGRELFEGRKEVVINDIKVPVKAEIEHILGYSSHKDSEHLLEFVAEAKGRLKKVFTVMGEPKSSLFLAQRIKDFLDVDAMYPQKEKEYIL